MPKSPSDEWSCETPWYHIYDDGPAIGKTPILESQSETEAGSYALPRRESPPLSWVGLAPFARFPQGIPEGIELTALQPKNDYGPTTQRP